VDVSHPVKDCICDIIPYISIFVNRYDDFLHVFYAQNYNVYFYIHLYKIALTKAGVYGKIDLICVCERRRHTPMKTVDPAVKRETRYIALWVSVFSAVMQAVFLILNKWDYTVLLGNTLSGVAAVANFFLMGLAVQSAVLKDEKDAATAMKASQSMRMFMLFAVAAVGVLLPCFNTWTTLIPLFFSRFAVMLRPLWDKRRDATEKGEA
jgi:hypothetical protein